MLVFFYIFCVLFTSKQHDGITLTGDIFLVSHQDTVRKADASALITNTSRSTYICPYYTYAVLDRFQRLDVMAAL